jgi:hypothetical protein
LKPDFKNRITVVKHGPFYRVECKGVLVHGAVQNVIDAWKKAHYLAKLWGLPQTESGKKKEKKHRNKWWREHVRAG